MPAFPSRTPNLSNIHLPFCSFVADFVNLHENSGCQKVKTGHGRQEAMSKMQSLF